MRILCEEHGVLSTCYHIYQLRYLWRKRRWIFHLLLCTCGICFNFQLSLRRENLSMDGSQNYVDVTWLLSTSTSSHFELRYVENMGFCVQLVLFFLSAHWNLVHPVNTLIIWLFLMINWTYVYVCIVVQWDSTMSSVFPLHI